MHHSAVRQAGGGPSERNADTGVSGELEHVCFISGCLRGSTTRCCYFDDAQNERNAMRLLCKLFSAASFEAILLFRMPNLLCVCGGCERPPNPLTRADAVPIAPLTRRLHLAPWLDIINEVKVRRAGTERNVGRVSAAPVLQGSMGVDVADVVLGEDDVLVDVLGLERVPIGVHVDCAMVCVLRVRI